MGSRGQGCVENLSGETKMKPCFTCDRRRRGGVVEGRVYCLDCEGKSEYIRTWEWLWPPLFTLIIGATAALLAIHG